MAHKVPTDLQADERIIEFKFMDLYLNRRGIIYNGSVTLFSALILKITGNFYVFAVLFIGLNLIAYPLAHSRRSKSKIEGGNTKLDEWFKRKFSYMKESKRYIRRSSM